MLMVVGKIGFARKESTIMTQVWGSGRPRSGLPSSPMAGPEVNELLPFSCYGSYLLPNPSVGRPLLFMCVPCGFCTQVYQLSTSVQSLWSYTLSLKGGHCEFLPDGVISCGVTVNILGPGASLPGFQFKLSCILVVCP